MLIQKLRLQRGWSQEQLAELSGLSVRTVQRLERGQNASPESLKAVASVFEIDFSSLRTEPMETTTEHIVSNEEALAFARVRKIKGFYIHVFQFVVVISVLSVVNIVTSPRHLWVLWVILGWGSGLFAHGMVVFDKVPFLNGAWEKRQVEKFLGRRL